MHRCPSSSDSSIDVRSIASILAVVAAVLLAPQGLQAKKAVPICTPQIPCSDPRGCPDLTIDPGLLRSAFYDVHTFAANDCAVVEGMITAGTRKLILFATETNNLGPGALVIGNPLDHPEWFDLVTCHGHAHIKDYADYRLWTLAGYDRWKALRAANPDLCAQQVLDGNPDLATQLVRGNKLGICFYDVLLMGQSFQGTQVCPRTPDPQTYMSCNDAGLGVCWSDIYEPIYGFVDGQWIDVTDVPDGDYVLENESNAKRLITEADYTNNSAALAIRIKAQKVHILRNM